MTRARAGTPARRALGCAQTAFRRLAVGFANGAVPLRLIDAIGAIGVVRQIGLASLIALVLAPVAMGAGPGDRAGGARPACIFTHTAGPNTIHRACAIDAPTHRARRSGLEESAARQTLDAVAASIPLHCDPDELRLLASRTGLATRALLFEQHVGGLPLHGAGLTIVTRIDGRVVTVHDRTRAIDHDRARSRSLRLTRSTAISTALQHGRVEALRSDPHATLTLHLAGDIPREAWRVEIPAAQPHADLEIGVGARHGKILWTRDLLAEASGAALVHDPNPVQHTGNIALEDGDDADSPELAATRVQVPLPDLSDDGFGLQGPYVTLLANTDDTAESVASEETREYAYGRDDPRFEQAMVYAHVDAVQRYIHALGFDDDNGEPNGIHDSPVLAVARADTLDQSSYSPLLDTLYFGTGGVDDAEDADIIVHEYGHAIQHAQNPCWGDGETPAMGEGFSDYLAASHFADRGDAAHQAEHAACVAEWDATAYATSTPACLRRTDGDKRYPDSLIGRPHPDGEIWSAALWEIRAALGAPVADPMILEHHFSVPCGASMRDAARALLDVAELVDAGAHHAGVQTPLCERGLLLGPDCVPRGPAEITVAGPQHKSQPGEDIVFDVRIANTSADLLEDLELRCTVAETQPDDNVARTAIVEHSRRDVDLPLPPLGPAEHHTEKITATLPATPSRYRALDDVEADRGIFRADPDADPAFSDTDSSSNSGRKSWFAPALDSGSDTRLTTVTPIAVRGRTSLLFRHRYDLEEGFDGGVVELSSDGEVWSDLGKHMLAGAYPGTISAGFGSPIAARDAFTGTSNGYVDAAIDLTPWAGESVALRFRAVTDNSVGAEGWFIDDIAVIEHSRIDVTCSVFADDELVAQGEGRADSPLPDPTCGDALIDVRAGETCDDGNTDTGDCCNAGCEQDAAGADCSDDDPCNGAEQCTGAGRCASGPPPTCNDENPCTVDSCAAGVGCTHTPQASASCSDGDACNGVERCDAAGVCQAGEPLACDDDNPCTVDLCQAQSGCVFTPASGDCSDGDACNGEEQCVRGECVRSEAPACDDDNVCTDDGCAPESGCFHRDNTAFCGNDACVGLGVCRAGACEAPPRVDCDDANPCTVDTCHFELGCVYADAEQGACNDGDPCNGTETCDGGRCVAGPAIDCDDGDQCTDDVCDALGACIHTVHADVCDDANPCTVGDLCAAGQCRPGPAHNHASARVALANRRPAHSNRIVIRSLLDLDAFAFSSERGALSVTLDSDLEETVFFVRIQADRFRTARRGRGMLVTERLEADGDDPAAPGIVKARISSRRVQQRVAVRLRAVVPSIEALPSLQQLSGTIVLDDGANEFCALAEPLPCAGSEYRRTCSTVRHSERLTDRSR